MRRRDFWRWHARHRWPTLASPSDTIGRLSAIAGTTPVLRHFMHKLCAKRLAIDPRQHDRNAVGKEPARGEASPNAESRSAPNARQTPFILAGKLQWRTALRATLEEPKLSRRRSSGILGGCGQCKRVLELHDLPVAVGVDYLDRGDDPADTVIDKQLARRADHMVELIEGDLDEVVLAIVGDADQWSPLGFDLVAQVQRYDLDFSLLADQTVRDGIKEPSPTVPIDLCRGHDSTPRYNGAGYGLSARGCALTLVNAARAPSVAAPDTVPIRDIPYRVTHEWRQPCAPCEEPGCGERVRGASCRRTPSPLNFSRHC